MDTLTGLLSLAADQVSLTLTDRILVTNGFPRLMDTLTGLLSFAGDQVSLNWPNWPFEGDGTPISVSETR